MPSATAWAVFPGRRLMPAKTRAFIDMLEASLAGAHGNLALAPGSGNLKT